MRTRCFLSVFLLEFLFPIIFHQNVYSQFPPTVSTDEPLDFSYIIREKEKIVKPGKNRIALTLLNQSNHPDIQNLSVLWVVLQNLKTLTQGNCNLTVAPHQNSRFTIPVDLPDALEDDEYILYLQLESPLNHIPYIQSVALKSRNWEEAFLLRLQDLKPDPDWNVQVNNSEIRVDHRDFLFNASIKNPGWFFITQDHHIRLITDGPFFRLMQKTADRRDQKKDVNPAVETMKTCFITDLHVEPTQRGAVIQSILSDSSFSSESKKRVKNATEPIQIQMDLFFSPFGYLDVRCELLSENLQKNHQVYPAFLLSSRLNRIFYLGDGPNPESEKGKGLPFRSIFHFNPTDILEPGFRSGVELAAVVDDGGYGLGIMMYGGKIGFERFTEGLLVSIDASVFRLFPLIGNRSPNLFLRTFASEATIK